MNVTFTQAWYKIRGKDVNVAGHVFELVQEWQQPAQGQGYVTVNGAATVGFPARHIRIRCDQAAMCVSAGMSAQRMPTPASAVTDLTQVTQPDSTVAAETDQEIMDRTRVRFDVLTDMTRAVKSGHIRAMIVTGPPGVGKSHGVEQVLTQDDLFNTLGERKPRYEIVKGAMSAIGLYKKLYEFSDARSVIVFDDCDSILLDDVSLNILKAALDTSKKRTISWNTDSRVLRSEGVPDRFDFRGGAIFITNLKFENVRSKKLQEHLAALESRCHYIDLKMDTDREKVLRIEQIVRDGMLDSYEFDQQGRDQVVTFIKTHRAQLRELSLRTVLKVADLRRSFADTWQRMAEVTVIKN